MYTISYTSDFAAAHRLPLHSGKCFNLHGHNYDVTFELKSEVLTTEEFVIDFGVLKQWVKNILDEFDHKVVLWEKDNVITRAAFKKCPIEVDSEISHYFPESGLDTVFIDSQPTCEIFARYFFDKMKETIIAQSAYVYSSLVHIFEIKVIVEEAKGQKASYENTI